MPAVVAGEPVVDEDDWEWTIARARARAEDSPEPAHPPHAAALETLAVASVTAASVTAKVTETTTSPSTVIPVPALPTVRGTANATRLAPVVRTIPAHAAGSPRRFPKGTGPQGPATTTAVRSDTTTVSRAIRDHTRLGVAPASGSSAVGDQTQVGLALPPAARAVALPSIKRLLSSR